ncbi:MAG: hypothetical protein ACK55X_00465 [Synechococcaceae cyanobacterium]
MAAAPASIARPARLHDNQLGEVEAVAEGVLIRPVEPRLSLAERLAASVADGRRAGARMTAPSRPAGRERNGTVPHRRGSGGGLRDDRRGLQPRLLWNARGARPHQLYDARLGL